jgi:hypothetical protein
MLSVEFQADHSSAASLESHGGEAATGLPSSKRIGKVPSTAGTAFDDLHAGLPSGLSALMQWM